MSSAVWSPHAAPVDLPAEATGINSLEARVKRPITYAASTSSRTRRKTSPPAPPTVSTRSRTRMSISPDKKAAEMARTNSRSTVKPSPRSSIHSIEEGEEELDDLGTPDHITVNGGTSSGSVPSEDGIIAETEKPTSRAEPETTPRVLRLVFGKGQKRKAEEEPDDLEVRVNGDISPRKAEVAEDMAVEQGEEPMLPSQEDPAKEPSKRAPRKKRKWLKKGEVDPDDHVAVARQKERHSMIDESIANLDRQLELIHEGTHPQLVEMLSELDVRRDRQLKHCDARFQAILSDYDNMRKHENLVTKDMFKVHREDLVDVINRELDRKHQIATYEVARLNMVPNNYPVLRDGRGKGGWPFIPGKLLSKNEEKLVPVARDSSRVRKDTSNDPLMLDRETAHRELQAMLVEPAPVPPKSPPIASRQRASDTPTVQPFSREMAAMPPPTNHVPPAAQPHHHHHHHHPLPPHHHHHHIRPAATSPVPSVPQNPARNGYALHSKEASYAWQPAPHIEELRDTHQHRPPPGWEGPRWRPGVPPPSTRTAETRAAAEPMFVSLPEYLASATCDVEGRPLPGNPYQREEILREGYRRLGGSMPRSALHAALPGFGVSNSSSNRSRDPLPTLSANPPPSAAIAPVPSPSTSHRQPNVSAAGPSRPVQVQYWNPGNSLPSQPNDRIMGWGTDAARREPREVREARDVREARNREVLSRGQRERQDLFAIPPYRGSASTGPK